MHFLGFSFATTAEYWINPTNQYGFTEAQVVDVITVSAETWDKETSAQVFSYVASTDKTSGNLMDTTSLTGDDTETVL